MLSSTKLANQLGSALLLCGAALGLAGPARAEDNNSGFANIVVTATRREVQEMQVPLSIVATSRLRLDNDRIQNISDLARSTPGLALRGAWGGTQKIAIRGIASGVGAPTTGIYIDDTPIQARALGSSDVFTNSYPEIFDIERIEVLRGPQGTLFGSGSEGGAIRFITSQAPLNHSEIYGRASIASTEGGAMSWQAGASFATPLVEDRLGIRVTAYRKREGGWIDRQPVSTAIGPDDNVNRRDVTSLRAALAFEAAPGFTLTPGIFYQRVNRRDTDQYWERLSSPGDNRYVTGEAVRQPSRDRFLLPSLKAELDLGGAKLLSNTAWFDRQNPLMIDYTYHLTEGLTRGLFVLPPTLSNYAASSDYGSNQKSFTQEVRLQSADNDAAFVWTVGAFYQNMRQTIEQRINDPMLPQFTGILAGAPPAAVFGVGLLPGNLSFYSFDRTRERQIAGFGQVDWKATDRLTLTLGARQSHTKVQSINQQAGPYNFGSSARDGGSTDNAFTPRAAASYRIADQGLVYASATRGFRPGGGNFSVPRLFCAGDLGALGLNDVPAGFGADKLWSYELGAKAGDRRVKAQASAFYTDWRDIQQSVPLVTCGTSYTANLGRAVSKGFDAQLELQPLDGLSLRGSVSYTDAYYKQSTFSNGQLLVGQGDKLPTPPWQVRLSTGYEFPVAGATGFVQFDYDYASSYQRLPDAPAQGSDAAVSRANATHLAGLRGGVQIGTWRVTGFVDNLFDSTNPIFRTHDSIYATIFRRQGFRPRTFGLELIRRM